MSKTIDQKVVEMQFDNRQFEKNVSTTMSSVDKLKKSLNFTGASKGLEDVSAAAKKVDMNSLGSAVESVRVKFSALQVMGVTALANITNSAVNAGKRIVSALTIDPVMTGFQEYETQINAIQTILANTSSKGSTLEDVNAALDELNTYADQTIYNFTEMTKNIGTFTAAGVDLDKSVSSIKGIANLAAVSGSTSQQASTAMYQLSQALAAGRVSLMDWNSVVNAGMGGEVFQTALKRTATQMGYNVDALIEKYGSFRESLTKGQWLTAEVLTETLTQLSGAYTEADLIAQGYSEEQAKQIVELADTAVHAATDVKTFTQLIDTTKEALQSGWTQSWELIMGDFEQAKLLWSEIGGILGDVIQDMSDSRNNLLEGALTSNWDKLGKEVESAGISLEDFNKELEKTARAKVSNFDEIIKKSGSLSEAFKDGSLSSDLIVETLKRMAGATDGVSKSTEDMTGKLEYFQKVVDQVWHGDFKNGEERVKALTAAGYDYAQVQALVNKTVDGHRLTLEDLSDTQLKAVGYTDQEITKLRELADQAAKTGTPLNELIENISKPSGRDLIWDSVTNLLTGLIDILKTVGEAWNSAFSIDSGGLYDMIEGFHSFTEAIKPSETTLDNLRRTLSGVFAIFDILFTLITRAASAVFGGLSGSVSEAGGSLLAFTAQIGDIIVAFRDWLVEGGSITDLFKEVGDIIPGITELIQGLIDTISELPIIGDVVEKISGMFGDMSEVGQDAIEGLQNGLKDGIKSIPQTIIEIGKTILNTIKDFLGIRSPSTEMYSIGQFSIQGLIDGIKDGASSVMEAMGDLGDKMLEVLQNIPWGTVAAVAITGGMALAVFKLADAVANITAPLEGLGNILNSTASVIDAIEKPLVKSIENISKAIGAFAFQMRMNAIGDLLKSVALSIAILAVAVYALGSIDTQKLIQGGLAVAALMTVMTGMMVVLGKWGPKGMLNMTGFSASVIALSAALLIMSFALKNLNKLDPQKMASTMTALTGIVVGMALVIAAFGTYAKGNSFKNITKVSAMMLQLSVALLLMSGVIKIIGGLSTEELVKGGATIAAFAVITGVLATIGKGSDKGISKVGSMMIKLSIALGLMVGVVKLISMLSAEEMLQGAAALLGFVTIIGLLMLINKVGPEREMAKIGGTMVAISIAFLGMVAVVKLLADMNPSDITKGQTAILGFTGIVALLVAIGKLAGKDMPRVSAAILSMSLSIAILAGVVVLLSLIDVNGLMNGIIAIGLLSTFVAIMIRATKGASDVKGSLIGISVAIGILAVAVAALSFISPEKLVAPTLALSALLGMFSLVLKMGGTVKASMGTLIVMTVAIGLLSGVLIALSVINPEGTLQAAAGLSLVLIALSVAMKTLNTMGKIGPQALIAVGVLTLVIAALTGILYAISALQITASLETVASLSALLLALSAATLILSKIGPGAMGAISGALALDGVIIVIAGLMAGIGALVTYFPQMEQFVGKGIDLLSQIAYGIGAFVGNLVGGALDGITAGLPGVADNLSDFMVRLQPFITGLKVVDASLLTNVGTVVGMILALTAAEFINGIGNLLSVFTGGSSLADFADELVPFGEGLVEFSNAISGKIDIAAIKAASEAGVALADMASTLPKEGGIFEGIFGSKQSLDDFGDQLKSFGKAIAGFSEEVKGKIDAGSVQAAADAGQTLANLANNLPRQGGVLQDFLGTQDLSVFGDQLKKFGKAIVAFSNEVKGKIDAEAVQAAADAGMLMSNLANNIPKQDGVLQDFLGEQDLGVFGDQLKVFGEGIRGFADEIGDGIDSSVVEAATNAGMALSNLANNLPKQDGLLQNFFGEQNMETFGNQLVQFGKNFRAYSTYMVDVKPDVVTATTNAADALVQLATKLPENKLFKNETTLDEFGAQLSSFGAYFAQYYTNISTIDVGTLSSVIDEMWNLVYLAQGMAGIDGVAVSAFSNNLTYLGQIGIDGVISAFTNAYDRVNEAIVGFINQFTTAVNANKATLNATFVSMIDEPLRLITNKQIDFNTVAKTYMMQFSLGIQAYKTNVNMTVLQTIQDALDTIRKQYPNFETVGRNCMAYLLIGINSQRSSIANAFDSVIDEAVQKARAKYAAVQAAGAFLASGFAAGIGSKSSAVSAAATKMANTASTAAKKTLKEKSPSKVGYEIGDFFGLGFINAIKDSVEGSYNASEEMAKSAREGLNNAISTISSIIDDDIDTQPTIRPVLDLSGVQTGVHQLDTMFTRNQALSINTGVSRTVPSSDQNGANSGNSAPVYQFTQNNYSPKALSRIDIYRQTKNQFSAFGRVVKT